MCPHANGDSLPVEQQDMVPVNGLSSRPSPAKTNGINGTNGVNGHSSRSRSEAPKNPYAPRYADFLSNVSNFNIIESTLRGTLLLTVPYHG